MLRCGRQHEYTLEVSQDDFEEQGPSTTRHTQYPWQQHPLLHPPRQLTPGYPVD